MEQLVNPVQSQGHQHRHIDDLPPEILHRVIQFLSPRDLKAAVLVNKSWMEVGEDPRMWTWAVIAIATEEDVQKKLNIWRLQLLSKLSLPNGWDMEESMIKRLFRTVDDIPSVRRIDGIGLCKGVIHADPSLVARVLNRLESLDIGEWRSQWDDMDVYSIPLSPEQFESLFTAMAEKTNIKKLCVHIIPAFYSKISPQLFGAAVSNVEEVDWKNEEYEGTGLQHQEALLTAIMVDSCPMRWLCHLVRFDPGIDPELIGRALNRLEEVDQAIVSGAQVAAILRNLVGGESRLKRLGLEVDSSWTVDRYDEELVCRAEDKLGDNLEFFY